MKITLNGRRIETSCKSLFELKADYRDRSDVVILNGFQTGEDLALHDGDTVSLIVKGVMPDEYELESLMAARHTPFVHKKLKAATVAVAGLGGLGSNIAAMLARIGVGRLRLIDFDVVEPSNLNRQNYYVSHLGRKKTDATAEILRQINPYLTVETRDVRVTSGNVQSLFADCDVICEAFDDPASKAELVSAALTCFPDTPIVAASGMAGYESSNLIRTERKFRNLYLCGDQETAAEVGRGLMAPRVQVCAGHQANMVLRLLLGIDEP